VRPVVAAYMTKKLFHDPQHWREHAEAARRLAAEIIDPPSRRTMLEIAESYERLARRTEQKLQELETSTRTHERTAP
jgi:hypothetical protein